MEKQDTASSNASAETPGVRPARLPGGQEHTQPSSSPDSDEYDQPTDWDDRGENAPTNPKSTISPETKEKARDELEKLEKWEEPIDQYQQATIEAALRVAWITEERLYQSRGYESVGTYAEERFAISRQRWYQFVHAGEVLDHLSSKQESTAVDIPLPSNEAQTRPLQSHRGDADFLWNAWKSVTKRYGPSPRREDVKSVVDELTSPDTPGEGETSDENSEGESGEPDSSDEGSGGASDNDTPSSRSPDDSPGSKNSAADSKDDGSGAAGGGKGSDLDSKSRGGFSISCLNSVEAKRTNGSPGGQSAALAQTEIEDLAREVEPEKAGLSRSSAEHMIASKAWRVLVSSLDEAEPGLPEKAPAEVILKPGRLDQITGLRPGQDRKRVLVCPDVDLFAEEVPSGVIRAILSRCRKTEHKPIVFTHHLDRAAGFDLSGLWIGTSTSRSSLSEKEHLLSEIAPNAENRWLLYDIEKIDREDAPSFSEVIDWVVYDPGDRKSGIALTLCEAVALTRAVEEVGAQWAFRKSFITCGDSFPITS